MRKFLAVLTLALLLPAFASAQSSPRDPEEDAGLATLMLLGTLVPVVMALPAISQEGHYSRPGRASWVIGVGFQGGSSAFAPAAPAFVLPADAGGYFPGAPWLGLDARFNTRYAPDAGFIADAAWLFSFLPTPRSAPAWLEILVGPSAELGSNDTYFTAGLAAGLRGGARIDFGNAYHMMFEGEGLYHVRFGKDLPEPGHQLEVGGMIGFLVDTDDDEDAIGAGLDYRARLVAVDETVHATNHRASLVLIVQLAAPSDPPPTEEPSVIRPAPMPTQAPTVVPPPVTVESQ